MPVGIVKLETSDGREVVLRPIVTWPGSWDERRRTFAFMWAGLWRSFRPHKKGYWWLAYRTFRYLLPGAMVSYYEVEQ